MAARWRKVGGWGKKGEGNKRCTFPLIKQIGHGDVMSSTGNIGNNIAITWYGDRWLLTL